MLGVLDILAENVDLVGLLGRVLEVPE
jgi:hypothetical protein